jgi:hypothetical protein
MERYDTMIFGIFSTSIVVLIVIYRVGATASAYYYLPSIIAGALGQLMWKTVTSFLVHASSEPEGLREHLTATSRIMLFVLVPGVVVGETLAPQILSSLPPVSLRSRRRNCEPFSSRLF